MAEFAQILEDADVRMVIDVRTVPRSRTNPQYNAEVLGEGLAAWRIGYDRIVELGGLRGRSRDVPTEVNSFWINQSFHNYADYALSDAFGDALDRLIGEAAVQRTAIMCSEAVWWRCHRRIIADYLLVRGLPVLHLMAGGHIEPARLTPAARERDGHLVYPAPGTEIAA